MVYHDGDEDDFDGGAPASPSVRCHSGWAPCHGWHWTLGEVKACFARVHQAAAINAMRPGAAGPCGDLIAEHSEDGIITVPCQALRIERENGAGSDCDAGHEYTTAQARRDQQWDYAGDDEEARQLARAGAEPRATGGVAYPL